MSLWLGFNALSAMVGAGLSWGLGHTHGSLATWQLVFLVSSSFDLHQFTTDSVQVVGVIRFSMGILALFVLPSSPTPASFSLPSNETSPSAEFHITEQE
jgi:hypothetical protein